MPDSTPSHHDIPAAPVSGSAAGLRSATVQTERSIYPTLDGNLWKIMLHEFWSESPVPGQSPNFDLAPLFDYIANLSKEQRQFLLNYPMGGKTDRLVIFITRNEIAKQKQNLYMGFDDTRDNRHHPNSSFAVFHCQGKGKDVVLLCLSEFMFVGSGQPSSVPKGIRPPKYQIATVLPSVRNESAPHCVTAGAFYNRILNADGTDHMPGNYFHGTINTQGCWSLFRNFNWYAKRYAEFEDFYRPIRHSTPSRTGGIDVPNVKSQIDENNREWNECDLQVKLHVHFESSDFSKPPTHGYSARKFRLWDRNWAYLWFFRWVVGIPYFSHSDWVNDEDVTGARLTGDPDLRCIVKTSDGFNAYSATERNANIKFEREYRKTLLAAQLGRLSEAQRALRAGDPRTSEIERRLESVNRDLQLLEDEITKRGSFNAWNTVPYDAHGQGPRHDADLDKKNHIRGLEWDAHEVRFRANAAGFTTASGFVPMFDKTRPTDRVPSSHTWADVYFYTEEGSKK